MCLMTIKDLYRSREKNHRTLQSPEHYIMNAFNYIHHRRGPPRGPRGDHDGGDRRQVARARGPWTLRQLLSCMAFWYGQGTVMLPAGVWPEMSNVHWGVNITLGPTASGHWRQSPLLSDAQLLALLCEALKAPPCRAPRSSWASPGRRLRPQAAWPPSAPMRTTPRESLTMCLMTIKNLYRSREKPQDFTETRTL